MENKPTKILIGMPVPANWKIFFPAQMFCVKMQCRPNVSSIFIPGALAEKGRNVVVHDMMKTEPDVTHILFMDADTAPPGDAIDKLLAHDKDIVAGVTPIWTPKGGPMWNVMAYDSEKKNNCGFDPAPFLELPDELFRAHYVGGPAVLIKRRVFEKMEYPWFDYNSEIDAEPRRGDIHFSVKAKDLGFELWCDPTIRCQHQHDVELLGVFDSCVKQFFEFAAKKFQTFEELKKWMVKNELNTGDKKWQQ